MYRGKSAVAITLTARQKSLLVQEVSRHIITVQNKQRIQIILQSEAGKSNTAISETLGSTVHTVSKWRKRWASSHGDLCEYEQQEGVKDSILLAKMLSILGDKARSGTPIRISLAEKQQIISLACKKPEDFGIPLTQWNRETLAKVAMAKGLVKKVSARYVSEILKKK